MICGTCPSMIQNNKTPEQCFSCTTSPYTIYETSKNLMMVKSSIGLNSMDVIAFNTITKLPQPPPQSSPQQLFHISQNPISNSNCNNSIQIQHCIFPRHISLHQVRLYLTSLYFYSTTNKTPFKAVLFAQIHLPSQALKIGMSASCISARVIDIKRYRGTNILYGLFRLQKNCNHSVYEVYTVQYEFYTIYRTEISCKINQW
jgi:hypothetical protein